MTTDVTITPRIGDCWNRIGVYGDRSCPELNEAIHCRNCFVYSSAGRVLLEREPMAHCREMASRQLSEEKPEIESEFVSLMVFRVQDEWFGIPVEAMSQVAEMSAIHRLPHYTRTAVLGLVSVQGEILLCVSLGVLLGLITPGEQRKSAANPNQAQRLLVLEDEESPWAIPVDEVQGMCKIEASRLKPVPGTVAHSASTFCRQQVSIKNQTAGVLHPPDLFEAFRRQLS